MQNHPGETVFNLNQRLANAATISDEPLDLSLHKRRRHLEKENESSKIPTTWQKVMAKLWQTTEVLQPEESLQRIMSHGKLSGMQIISDLAVVIAPESFPMTVKSDDVSRRKKQAVKDLISGDSSRALQPHKKRNRFTITQLFLLEKVFEMRMFLKPKETQELARLLDVEECRVKVWFQTRRQKWKKENESCEPEHVRMSTFGRQLAVVSQQSNPSSST